MNLIFMRHGMPDIEPDSRRCIGQTDYPLSPYGRKQMEESAVRLKNIYTPNIIYCSPLLRCIQSVYGVSFSAVVFNLQKVWQKFIWENGRILPFLP